MRFITLDFETYYDDQYSLSKMRQEDYVADPRFEVILLGVKIDHEPAYWITGTEREIEQHIRALKPEQCGMLAHNNSFDALICAQRWGIYFAMYFDTRLLAQAMLKPYLRSVSLDSCCKHLASELGGIQKGSEVHNMKGRTRQSLAKAELDRYGAYCVNDCEAEYRLFRYLAPQMPRSELEIIDLTLRMYLQPQLKLDATLLAEHLAAVQSQKQQVINSLPPSVTKDLLMSNVKFAALLESYGITCPLKISAQTGNATYAFAKSDTGWKELEEEWADDPEVSAILAARISAKSTLEEARSQKLLDIATRYSWFRVPILYHAAHTGRDGGYEGINAQNLPRIDKSRMRFGVVAPRGSVVLAADLAQIEARITAWLAGQQNLLTGFRNKEDVYSAFASTAFQCETIKDRSPGDNKRRFVGKTCVLGLGFGMSSPRLRATLRKDGVKATLEECDSWVDTYRNRMYPAIPALWRKLDEYIKIMAGGMGKAVYKGITFAKNTVVLPDGTALIYNNLRWIGDHKKLQPGFYYDFAGETRSLWGGKLVENIVQKLARILVMGYMLTIKHTIGIIPALRQHDELDYVVPLRYADKVKAVIRKLMTVPPWWAPDLPIGVDINYGPTLGDCK